MDDRRIPPGPGKTAPRLINDLLDHDPRYSAKHGRNLLADPAPKFRGIGSLPARKGPSECRHTLMKKEHQTNAPISNDELPDEATEYKVAAYCSTCLYHFDITVDFWQRKDRQAPCHLSDRFNPLHHLRLVKSTNAREYREKHGVNKYDTVTEAHRFVCSGEKCPLVVDIKISPPRLSHSILSLVLDPAKMDMRGRREIKNDPDRYQGLLPVKPLQALGYLRQYLHDAKGAKSRTDLKKIARRNKKYMLAFADECDELFEHLDFVAVQEDTPEPDEGPNYFWQLPIITDANRNFIEDVLYEIDVLIVTWPSDEGPRATVHHMPALKDIERSLGCFDYPTRSRMVDLSGDEHPYYISLGVVDNFRDDFLSWAYDRQCVCDPSNKPYYLDCLKDLANGRKSLDLEMKVVMATSAGELGEKAIEESYIYFNLDPGSVEGDDHIMGLYKSRIESAPRQKDEAKECLRIIAKHRNSEKIEALANDKTMTFEEALEFLSVSGDTASDSIEAVAVAMSLDGDKAKVARALHVIANQRSDFTLQRAAASMESGTSGSTLDVGDAYNRLQIGARNAPDETVLTYYQSLSNGAPSGSKDSYTEALRVIALDRQSNFLLRKLEDPNADVQAGTAEPVGLDNIGNTCYLNSLLQYYYTIKPVRDMVINFQQHRMSLNEEDIKKKRVGGRIVDKSEIIKAQKFVDELHNLFENLKTASTRSIKPTRELAELTIFSSAAVADFRRSSISSPHGPPNLSSILDGPVYGPQWPPPPPPSLPTTVEEDIEMVDHPDHKNADNGDDSSEATLVDLEQLPSYNEATGNEEPSPGGDAVMVNGDESSPEANKSSASEKPPPVPPRNKSGLVIQTNENKDLLPNDELWKFGSQQDVTEVIGNVMFRLQCAIKPTSIEESSGAQIDIIRDTFFGANTVYTQKAQSLERKTEAWPSIIVFPGKVGRDIYEALDVVYDEQQVEIDNTTVPQYASLSKLPPILQIHIQRTDFDHENHRAFKNRNPVVFQETIYLDRYVDSGDPDSPVMRRRRESWKWKEQLRVLEARQAALKNEEAQINVPDALLATKDFVSNLQEEEIEGIDVDPALPEALEERIAELAAELEAITAGIVNLKKKLQGQFVDMHEYEYKLQSVFIHRGEAGGGHYWIYIYDFEHDIWREYNDEYVSEVKDRKRIFEHQGGAGGTPYYLVYVKSTDIKNLVDAVCRDVQEVQMTDETEEWPDLLENGVSSGVDGDEDTPGSRHIEHAKPRPLRPKIAALEPAAAWEEVWTSKQEPSEFDANGKRW